MEVLEHRRVRLIRAIVNDTDEERMSKVEKLYREIPLLYPDEEVERNINISREQYKNRDVIICKTASEAIKHLELL
jgi:hypothetical protein